jgi:hypothetical protein
VQNAIFDEFMGLVEARMDATRQAGTLDLGLETIAVQDFTVLSDTLLRTDLASGATTHLLELEIARALKPLILKRLEETDPRHFGTAGLDTPGTQARTFGNQACAQTHGNPALCRAERSA